MSDEEFQKLMTMQKHINDDKIELPTAGALGKTITVVSDNSSDVFIIDSDRRSTITMSRKKLQERHANTQERLIRLEIDSKPHTNPDGKILSRNHIHIFSEEYGLAFAYDLEVFDDKLFKDLISFEKVFYDFCKFCNIKTDGVQIQGVI